MTLSVSLTIVLALSCLLLSTEAQRPEDANICSLPLVHGDCEAFMMMWGFKDGSCQLFQYGGCGANANNFKSKSECMAACPGVKKDDSTTAGPQVPALCKQPLKTGFCKARIMRWGFTGNSCQQFVYGGCMANENNFGSKEECNAACPAIKVVDKTTVASVTKPSSSSNIGPKVPDICKQPLKTGMCRAAFRRWGFKGDSCQMFVYGGCGANDNNFATKSECAKACSVQHSGTTGNDVTKPTRPAVPEQCKLPLVTGPCQALFWKWGFKGDSCQEFTYGGCMGNDNNFGSKEECMSVCGNSRVVG